MTCSPQLYVCLLDTIAGLFSRQSDGAIGAASRCFVQAPFLESSESSSFSHLELLSSRRKIRCDCMRLRLLPRFDRRCFDPNPSYNFDQHQTHSHYGMNAIVTRRLSYLCWTKIVLTALSSIWVQVKQCRNNWRISASQQNSVHHKVTWCYNQNAALPQYYAL